MSEENTKVTETTEGDYEVDGLDQIEIANTPIDDIDSDFVNLMFIGIDESTSMIPEIDTMRDCLAKFKDALINSKQAGDILIARADFNDAIKVGGYKHIDSLDTGYVADGCTHLYDVIVDGVQKLLDYKDFLWDGGTRSKAVFAIFSDGEDVGSSYNVAEAKSAIEKLKKKEITTAFIAFGSDAQREARTLGFKNILDVSSSSSELRKAFDCLSKSVIESSKSDMPDEDDFFKVN